MNNSKFRLGLFILLGFILCGILFIVFGLNDYTAKKVRMVTYFTESVQGLEAGSLVKYRGVPIGKVDDISILIGENVIRVDMVINLSKVRTGPNPSQRNTMTEKNFFAFMEKEIQKGLYAHLALNGISGYKYVEFDFRPKDLPKPPQITNAVYGKDGIFCMPSEPSMLAGLRYGITEVVAKIAAIDYKKLADKIESVLNSMDILISDPKLKASFAHVENVSKETALALHNFNSVFTDQRMNQISNNVTSSLENINGITRRMEIIVQQAKVPETTESFREAAKAVADVRTSLNITLEKLNESIDSLHELIRSIDENPTQLFKGKH